VSAPTDATRAGAEGVVAVIGAGMAGLAAAAVASSHGRRVTVFEKARGPGGRMSTRRVDKWTFDHGATALRPGDVDDELVEQRLAVEWSPRRLRLGADGEPMMPRTVRRLVGVPGMSSLTDGFVQPFAYRFEVHVERLERARKREVGRWRLIDRKGRSHGPFTDLVVALPAPQAAVLLRTDPDVAEFADLIETHVEFVPRWALLAGWDHDATAPDADLGWDLVEGSDEDAPIVRISRESSKPGRPKFEAIVVHAGIDWSIARLEHDPATIAPLLIEAARKTVGTSRWPRGAPTYVAAHRWRYAEASPAIAADALMDRTNRIFICGDWCGGYTIGAAKKSGASAASALRHP